MLDGDVLPEFEPAGVMVMFKADMGTQAIEHLDDLCCLPLGPQVDLQIKMIAPSDDDTYPVLLHQHEGSDQHRLERGKRRQQREGEGIDSGGRLRRHSVSLPISGASGWR